MTMGSFSLWKPCLFTWELLRSMSAALGHWLSQGSSPFDRGGDDHFSACDSPCLIWKIASQSIAEECVEDKYGRNTKACSSRRHTNTWDGFLHSHDCGCISPLKFVPSISVSALLCWAYRTSPVVYSPFVCTSGSGKLQPDLAVWLKKQGICGQIAL